MRDSENSAPKQRKTTVTEENAINTQPKVNDENEETVEEVGEKENNNEGKEMDEIERNTNQKKIKRLSKKTGNHSQKHLLSWHKFEELKLIISNKHHYIKRCNVTIKTIPPH